MHFSFCFLLCVALTFLPLRCLLLICIATGVPSVEKRKETLKNRMNRGLEAVLYFGTGLQVDFYIATLVAIICNKS
jgi:hypothetical protein